MKKSSLKKCVSLCCLFCSCFIGLVGCTKGESADKISPITRFSYSHGAMSSWYCYNFTIERTESGATLEFRLVGIEKPLIKELDGAVLDELLAMVNDYKMSQWDGFQGPNPPGVLDGTQFSVDISFADGSSIYAGGSNNFPENYGPVSKIIADKVDGYRNELLVREGLIKEEVPPAHLQLVYLDSYKEPEMNIRHRRVRLTPEYAQKYPALAQRLMDLDEKVLSQEGSAILTVVRADNRVTSLTLYEQPAADSPEQDCRISAFNYYTEDGKEITLSDIEEWNKTDFIRQLRNELRARYGEKNLYDIETIHQNMLAAPEKLVFSAANEAVIFYWQPGEVAPADKGIRQVNFNYEYLHHSSKALKEHPETWSSGMVLPMDIYNYVADPDIEKIMKQLAFEVWPGTETGTMYHVHLGFEKEYMFEYYTKGDSYSPELPKNERVYRIKGEDIAGCVETGEVEMPEVNAEDYSNSVFGPTEIYPVILDPSELAVPEELQ